MLILVLLTLAAAEEASARTIDPNDSLADPKTGPAESAAEAAVGFTIDPEPTPEATAESSLGPMIDPAFTHLRPVGANAAALLKTATENSSIIADLLKRLDRTDVVVYVMDLMPWSRNAPKSHLVFLTSAAGTRYLMIRIDRWRLSPIDRIASLGHELQHALEVAAAPSVRDSSGLSQLYKRIGWVAEEGRFESADARKVGERVRKQLLRRGR